MEQAKKTNETVEQWIDPAQETELRKRAGMYIAKDVDRYVEKLNFNMRNMETAYHERFEEMRTLLISVTREKEEYQAKVQALEKSVQEVKNGTVADLEKKGFKALPLAEYQMLTQFDEDAKRTISQLETKLKKVTEENTRLLKQLDDGAVARRESETVISQVQKLKEMLNQREKALQDKSDELTSIHVRASEAETAVRENLAVITQLKNKCSTLELNERLLQNEFLQLKNDKERAVKESEAARERWEAERDALVKRYRVLLTGQRHSMQRLHENVAATVKYMESLGESAMISLGLEEI
jgi:chromosome segregation ATPase